MTQKEIQALIRILNEDIRDICFVANKGGVRGESFDRRVRTMDRLMSERDRLRSMVTKTAK